MVVHQTLEVPQNHIPAVLFGNSVVVFQNVIASIPPTMSQIIRPIIIQKSKDIGNIQGIFYFNSLFAPLRTLKFLYHLLID